MRVEEVMTRDVVRVPPDASLKEVAALLTRHHVSGLPVCAEDGAVLGVVSEADILRKEEGVDPGAGGRFGWVLRGMDGELAKVGARTAAEAMTAPAVSIGPRQLVAEAAGLMLRHGINRLPVVSEGKLVGIVTRADLVRAFEREDEEIAQEIRDDVVLRTLWLPPDSVDVLVADGVVTLRGEVDTRTTAEVAVRCCRYVPGVVEVRDELTWRPTRSPRRRLARHG